MTNVSFAKPAQQKSEFVCPASAMAGVPTGYGQKAKHMEGLSYDELMNIVECGKIGHPYFDVRFSVYQSLFRGELNARFKELPRQRQKEEMPRLQRYGLRPKSKFKQAMHKFWMATAADPRV